jgi:hypothetical protein
LVTVLNFYEELAIATLRNSDDEDRLYAFFSGIIQQSATRLESWCHFLNYLAELFLRYLAYL